MYTNKPASETKDYFAFDALSRILDPASTNGTEQAEQEGWDAQKLWDDITRSYQMLRFWYEDHDYYHWIGYLSDQNREIIRILLQHAKEMRKSDFKDFVFAQIRQTISRKEMLPELEDLEYGKDSNLIINCFSFLMWNMPEKIVSPPDVIRSGASPSGSTGNTHGVWNISMPRMGSDCKSMKTGWTGCGLTKRF